MSLKVKTDWLNEGLGFQVEVRDHQFISDAKESFGGKNKGPTPKEYVLAGLCGCTGMDVVSLMKKYRLQFTDFSVSAESDLTEGHPSIFSNIKVTFSVKSENIESDMVKKAVDLSMTRYCGVSAMLSKSSAITYDIKINDELIGSGTAEFSF